MFGNTGIMNLMNQSKRKINIYNLNFTETKNSQDNLKNTTNTWKIEEDSGDEKERSTKIISPTVDVENIQPGVIVKFIFGGEKFATVFKPLTTIGSIKTNLAKVLELEEDCFDILRDNLSVDKNVQLVELCVELYCRIVFEIISLKEDGNSIILDKIHKNIPTRGVIRVNLGDSDEFNDIVVEIKKQFCQKEWFGGYKNKRTNNEYHNAVAQTDPKERKVFNHNETGSSVPLLYHRDTQTTFKSKEISQNTVVHRGTQMWRSDLFISTVTDKLLSSRPYVNYADWYKNNNNLKAIITIQKAVRSWLRDKRVLRIIQLQKTLTEEVRKQKLQILKEQADKTRIIITGAAYPVDRDDFYMLYLMVGDWWKKEWKKLCALKIAETKKTEAVALLNKEVKMIEAIEKHRIVSKREALNKEKIRFLEKTSQPLIFKNSLDMMVSIDDLDTQKAREFKDIYVGLFGRIALTKNIINALINLQNMFLTKYDSYEYAHHLVELIGREIFLLNIGAKQRDLEGLHKRIEQLYFNFLRQNEYNPKATKYKKSNLPKTIQQLFFCIRCKQLLPASKFPVHVRMISYDACKSCVWLQNIGYKRADMSPYLKLLKHVQNTEMEKCCHSAVCFILQPIGMCYLTNNIWHGHSAISECQDLSKLQHVRWKSELEWAPWNTILLTDQEAKFHAGIPDVLKFYGKSFVGYVRRRHILARARFIPLLKMNHDICKSGVWSNVKDSGTFLHPSHAEMFSSEN